MSTLIIMMRVLFIIMRVKPIENIGDNSTSVDPFRAHAKFPIPPLRSASNHHKATYNTRLTATDHTEFSPDRHSIPTPLNPP